MFEADAEMAKLKFLPGIDDITERYRAHVQGVAESYRAAGLANASKKEEQVRDVVNCHHGKNRRNTALLPEEIAAIE